jgi:hypothetical protein
MHKHVGGHGRIECVFSYRSHVKKNEFEINMKFSIISVDYDQHVQRAGIIRALSSLGNQTFKDFEWIIVHDGPKQVPYNEEFDFALYGTAPRILDFPVHAGEWGYNAREYAMRNAHGDFFLHLNIDNILYPKCLSIVEEHLRDLSKKIAIFEIFHHKLGVRLSGNPPLCNGIDLMQYIVHRNIWEQLDFKFVGHHYNADGTTIEHLAANNPGTIAYIPEILGENF